MDVIEMWDAGEQKLEMSVTNVQRPVQAGCCNRKTCKKCIWLGKAAILVSN